MLLINEASTKLMIREFMNKSGTAYRINNCIQTGQALIPVRVTPRASRSDLANLGRPNQNGMFSHVVLTDIRFLLSLRSALRTSYTFYIPDEYTSITSAKI